MKSSSWIDQTWQHNNRKEFFILFTSIWAAISLYNLHGSCLWQSITETGATPNPQPARGGIGLGRWSCLFPSDILSSLCSVLCASSQSAGSLSTLLSLQAGQRYWAVFGKKKKKKHNWDLTKERDDINKADQTWSRQRDYIIAAESLTGKVDIFYQEHTKNTWRRCFYARRRNH